MAENENLQVGNADRIAQTAQNFIDAGTKNYVASHGKNGLDAVNYGLSLLGQREGVAPGEEIEKLIDGNLKVADILLPINPDQAKSYLMGARKLMRYFPWPDREDAWWTVARKFAVDTFTTEELYSSERPEAFYKALGRRAQQANTDYRNVREIAEEKIKGIPKDAQGDAKKERDKLQLLIAKCNLWEGLYTLGKHTEQKPGPEAKTKQEATKEEEQKSPTQKALDQIKLSIQLFDELNQKTWKARALIDYANSLTEQKQYDPNAARTQFKEVYKILDEIRQEGDPNYPEEDAKTDPPQAVRGLAMVKEGKIDLILADKMQNEYEEHMKKSLALVEKGLVLLEDTEQYYFRANAEANAGRAKLFLARYYAGQGKKKEDVMALMGESDAHVKKAYGLIDKQAHEDTEKNLHGAVVYKGQEVTLYLAEREEYGEKAQATIKKVRSAIEAEYARI